MLHYGEKITADGQLLDGNTRTNINYSSILSELIQAAGTLCEYFASDLFYDLKEIEYAVDNVQEKVLYIGIRNSGVDSLSAVTSRLRDDKYGKEYIRLYRLETAITDHSYTMELRRIDAYDARHDIGIS